MRAFILALLAFWIIGGLVFGCEAKAESYIFIDTGGIVSIEGKLNNRGDNDTFIICYGNMCHISIAEVFGGQPTLHTAIYTVGIWGDNVIYAKKEVGCVVFRLSVYRDTQEAILQRSGLNDDGGCKNAEYISTFIR